MPSSPRSPMRRAAANSGYFSPAGPSSSTGPSGEEGSASKSGRRNNSSALAATVAGTATTAPQSLPSLVARTLLGFTLGSLGVLAFMWLSSLATTADGTPSTLLLARQRYDREVRGGCFFFLSSIVPASRCKKKKKTQPLSTSKKKNEKKSPALPRPRPRGDLLRGRELGRRLLRPVRVDSLGQGLVRPEGGGPPGRDLQAARELLELFAFPEGE